VDEKEGQELVALFANLKSRLTLTNKVIAIKKIKQQDIKKQQY